jgi:hypothetical protein
MTDYVTFSNLGKHGRLGNQLFQIAAVYSYAKKYNKTPILKEWYCYYNDVNLLDIFNIEKYFIIIDNLPNGFTLYKEKRFNYDEFNFISGNVDLLGYFQSELYFSDYISDIIDMFSFKPDFIDNIKSEIDLKGNLIAVHVRRGDYINHQIHYVCDDLYYDNAINFINGRIDDYKLIFFSDDNKWVNDNKIYDRYKNSFYYNSGNFLEDFYIMSKCNHFIISNSTFSWWASLLSNSSDKMVITPSKWFNSGISEYETIYRPNMIKI